MKKYHQYVFDQINRSLIGKFDEMYANEHVEGFDSWQERDLRPLRKKIALTILDGYNYDSILELGCGKGTFTHLLKKENNKIVAVDISENAIRRARASYPDIDFRCDTILDAKKFGDYFDICLIMGVFAYVKEWKSILSDVSKFSGRCFVCEYIPQNPIGFVKSIQDIVLEFEKKTLE